MGELVCCIIAMLYLVVLHECSIQPRNSEGEGGGGVVCWRWVGVGVSMLVSSISNCLLISTYAKTNLLQHKDWFVQIALKTAKASLI